MPDTFRIPLRMDCGGIDLTHPLDRLPPGSFAYLFNVRILEEGRLDGRPGFVDFISLTGSDTPNSIRRLNDPDGSHAPAGYTYVGGGGANLYVGDESTYAPVDNGYSGLPLSLIPFRPEASPESWMYVYDKNKSTKVRPDGTLRPIGVAPPSNPPGIEFGTPAMAVITEGVDPTGWTGNGATVNASAQDRTAGATATISGIVYNAGAGASGWACLAPNSTSSWWAGERMRVVLDSGGPNAEIVTIREIHPPIPATTIASIQYDSGSAGLCSIVLADFPAELARNSLININSAEIVRVLEVIPGPDGTTYSFRCSTGGTYAAGNSVVGVINWYVWTATNHVAGETITEDYIAVSPTATTGASSAELGSLTLDASTANGRRIDDANDWMHISVYLTAPVNLTSVDLAIDIDDGNFTRNYWTWTITAAELISNGISPGAGTWTEIVVPISSGTRTGGDFTKNFSTIAAIRVGATITAACDYGFDAWYFFGTYGQVIQPNAPVGMVYTAQFRDSSTGAHSVPGPFNRYSLNPLREEIIVSPVTTTAAGVDQIDLYRLGGTVTDFLYVASVANNPSSPQSFSDGIPDIEVLKVNQPPDLTALQPWPELQNPWTGTVNVSGTSVQWQTGDQFNLALLNASIILINGTAYQTFSQPRSATFLELTQSAGNQSNVSYSIPSPTLAAQPLAFVFGPLEGPFAPVVFGLGDPLNGGLLYYSNFSDADSASDQNTLELAGPGNDLVSGAAWNGLAICGNRDQLFCVRFSYLQASGGSPWQWYAIPSPSGIWSRWACCATPVGVFFLGRDGIYLATENGAVNISDERLYPLFPHDGVPAQGVTLPGILIPPVDMNEVQYLRLSYLDERVRFQYLDTGRNSVTLEYEIYKKRWLLNVYGKPVWTSYQSEFSAEGPNRPSIMLLGLNEPKIYLQDNVASDAGVPITSIALTPYLDSGDERAQKLYVDAMIQAGDVDVDQLKYSISYDNAQSFGALTTIVSGGPGGGILQYPLNLNDIGTLELHRNIAIKLVWTGGVSGPKIYAFEPQGYLQPFLSKRITTQVLNLSFPGWKSHRRLYPALISTADVTFTIKTQDGRTYTATIPSTAGKYRILPMMLNAGIKDLAFAYELDGGDTAFALFPSDFVVETKEWTEAEFISLAVFKT